MECGAGRTGGTAARSATICRSAREFINIAATLNEPLPYRPGVAELVKRRTAAQDEDPNAHCMPRGAPESGPTTTTERIFQLADRVVILTERNMQYRQIFTDGRPLLNDPNPTWNGYSTAKWDGDTLVVQTNGFKDGLWLDANGNPLGNTGTFTERIRRPNYGTLEVQMTIDDPTFYTAPWTVTLQTAAGARQRAAGLLLPRKREVPGTYGQDEEVRGVGTELDARTAHIAHSSLVRGSHTRLSTRNIL